MLNGCRSTPLSGPAPFSNDCPAAGYADLPCTDNVAGRILILKRRTCT